MKINIVASYEEATTVTELRKALELLEGLGLGNAVVFDSNGAPLVVVESAGSYHARTLAGDSASRRAIRIAAAQRFPHE